MCLVVLDDVWHEDIIDSFAATGFHLLVTTRRRAVVPRRWSGTFTEVRGMEDEEALDLLRRASEAAGPLPEHEATSVSLSHPKQVELSLSEGVGRVFPAIE